MVLPLQCWHKTKWGLFCEPWNVLFFSQCFCEQLQTHLLRGTLWCLADLVELFPGKQTVVKLGRFVTLQTYSYGSYADTCCIGTFEVVKLLLRSMKNNRILQGLNYLILIKVSLKLVIVYCLWTKLMNTLIIKMICSTSWLNPPLYCIHKMELRTVTYLSDMW